MKDNKYIKGFLPYDKSVDIKQYYMKKYNAKNVFINFGVESQRNNKIGINYEAIVIPRD